MEIFFICRMEQQNLEKNKKIIFIVLQQKENYNLINEVKEKCVEDVFVVKKK